MSAAESPTDDAEHVDESRGQLALEGGHDADDRRLEPLVAERGRAVARRERASRRPSRRARSGRRRARSPRTATAAASVRARAPPRRGWRRSRARCRRGSRAAPRRAGRRASPGPARARSPSARVSGENTSARPRTTISAWTARSSSATTSAGEWSRVRRRAAPRRSRAIATTVDDDVPRRVAERVDVERGADVVRQEQRRQRDHDQVVEEERPAGDEADEVVEGTSRERLGAARLGDRGGALRVRERDDEEDERP